MAKGPSRRERGAVTVEFVLVLPFFLFLIFEVINYGMMLSFRQTLSQAAAEGARAAAVAPPHLDGLSRIPIAKAAVGEAFQGQIGQAVSCDGGGLTCVVVATNPCTTPPCRISVELRYNYRSSSRDVMPHIFGNPLPATLTYTASSRWK
jgi:Flp pilus assembly protein TadG